MAKTVGEMTKFQTSVAQVAWHRLFTQPFFNLYGLRELAAFLQIELDEEGADFKALKLLHGMHWHQMSSVTWAEIAETCRALLQNHPAIFGKIQDVKRKSLWQRLFS